MKSVILLLCIICFASFTIHAQKHKSEAALAAMTPTQRVDEWVNEQVHHRYDLSDHHDELIRKYVTNDGTKALPPLTEVINEYDPTRFREGEGRRGERFDAAVQMLGYIDGFGIRLRSSEEGKRAIDSLGQALERMRKAGYGQADQHDWARHGRFGIAMSEFENAKGISFTDRAIKDTLRIKYNIKLSDAETLDFVNFLTTSNPNYPSWSELENYKDETDLNSAGNPLQFLILKKPESYYEAYSKFKKLNQENRIL